MAGKKYGALDKNHAMSGENYTVLGKNRAAADEKFCLNCDLGDWIDF
jgi:hypothetical protein